MKLISLNTWDGKIYQPLMDFIKKHANDTDIFCFQEVFDTTSDIEVYKERRVDLYKQFSKSLPDHRGLFYPSLKDYVILRQPGIEQTNFNLYFGLAIFISKDLLIKSQGDFFVYGQKFVADPNNLDSLPHNVQYLTFTNSGKNFTVCNLHGIWLKEGKKDSPSRLKQSKIIKEFLDNQNGGKILCGDFNLDISTKSIKILENNLRNLIKEYSIKTTRNKHFPGSEKFADYMFVSEDINVKNFKVPDINISDHLPMIIEFS